LDSKLCTAKILIHATQSVDFGDCFISLTTKFTAKEAAEDLLN